MEEASLFASRSISSMLTFAHVFYFVGWLHHAGAEI